MNEELKAALLKNINVRGFVVDMLDGVIKKSLDKVVANTSNNFDNIMLESMYPALREELVRMIDEKLSDEPKA